MTISDRDQRLLDAIFRPTGTQEETHEKDCFACDLAAQIAGAITAHVHFGTRIRIGRHELDGWQEPATLDDDQAIAEDTRLDLAHRIAAYYLHKNLPGHAPNSPDRRP